MAAEVRIELMMPANAAIKVLAMPEVKAKLEKLGATPVGDTPQHFAQQITAEVAKNKKVAAAAKISLD